MRDAAVGMHRALGRAGRARRVDENGEIVGAAAADHRLPQRLAALLVVLSQRHEFGQRQHHRVVEAAQPLHVEHDDLLQRRAARAARQDLVELLFILGEDHPGRGIVDEIFDLGRGIGRIDSGRDAAGAENAHVGKDPFRDRVGDDRGDVAGPEADGVQGKGNVLGYLQPLPPTGRLPDAEFLFTDRRPVTARRCGKQKTLCDRVGDRQHCRSGHARFLPLSPASDAGLGGRSFFEAGPKSIGNPLSTLRSSRPKSSQPNP